MPDSPEGPQVSGPERALLEMLSEVGVHQEVDEASGIMEGVRQLRTRYLQQLLPNYRQVKAIRLCVIWARELELPWAEQAHQAACENWQDLTRIFTALGACHPFGCRIRCNWI